MKILTLLIGFFVSICVFSQVNPNVLSPQVFKEVSFHNVLLTDIQKSNANSTVLSRLFPVEDFACEDPIT